MITSVLRYLRDGGMKKVINKFRTYSNITGLLYIIFYFAYIGVNMYNNKGDYIINILLLVLTLVYFGLYIYSVFIENNRKMKRRFKKIFKRSRKALGFINASLILASLINNQVNNFFTIFLAVLTLLWYLLYLIIDIASSFALHEFKKYSKELGWNYDNWR